MVKVAPKLMLLRSDRAVYGSVARFIRSEKLRMARVLVKQPHVEAELCIGCGICQNKCPMSDRAAVLVTSVGETRNPDNQILLEEAQTSPYG